MMELKWLEDFLALAACGSFSRAAIERNVTQPAFGRRIRALENWTGTPLVDRTTFPAVLTPAGREFQGIARQIVRCAAEGREAARALDRRARSVVAFAALHSIAVAFLPDWIGRIEAQTGPFAARVQADNLHDCVQALASGDADLMLSYAHPSVSANLDDARFAWLKLGQDRVLPLSAPDAEGRPRHALRADGRRRVPYLAYAPDTFLGRIVDGIVARGGPAMRLDLGYESAMAEGLQAMALEGRGVAWLPESLARAAIAARRLVPAAVGQHAMGVDLRLYRNTAALREEAERIWRAASANADPA
jgi:DNA-binding transcriptional LysR family regulator